MSVPRDLAADFLDVAIRLVAHYWAIGDGPRAERWARVVWNLNGELVS